MYLTGAHNIVPSKENVSEITHVSLAFMNSSKFHENSPSEFPLFTSVDAVREKFAPDTKVIIAIGGWGDTAGFSIGAKTGESRELWAKHVAKMIEMTGADGIDVDWEFPGGNGYDYKIHPNSEKEWEIAAYPLFLAAIRDAIGPDKIISAAVPAKSADMLAFTKENMGAISAQLDYLNIMTYDMMSIRDNVTNHHTGLQLSLASIDEYISRGLDPGKIYLGFAFYVKWFRVDPASGCTAHNAIGCSTVLMEDPNTGADLGKAGALVWVQQVPSNLKASFEKAMSGVQYDDIGGGSYYFDADENIFWSWDTPDAIRKKFAPIVQKRALRGVFAWGLGEDANKFEHLKALNEGVRQYRAGAINM
ncbi:glycoside hydrolase [Pseudovirgaria hyperparasitica]|uniref:chitinase n=1 Tax=Pseudovirgaria hyperparasitica TaxID=470096 RepID=A0A6A6W7T3_9PEZI|nr:glycoside hydrolase [Pseudovirgaria hyperparasitica]KAF2757946.1 glycoside hydrolase [Pseudovirgaria hyperparasitica]